uniref:Sodium/iodide cotransporter n=1 Tax=Cacopsylla melanoneura TaxID=428564 RepID=A0A8D8VF55_9HEMI
MGSLWIDYGVFGLLLLASISVSIWSKLSGPKEKTKADYVFAQNNVSMGAMILSIARGFLGVRVFLGYPSELYYRGSEMWETLYGMVLAFPIVLYFFVPVYFNLGVTSVYQYLDMRFKSRFVRRLASGTYLFRSLLNLGVTVFTPCVALKTVLGSPYSLSIIAITSISIVFTVLGGLRSAITADVVQCVVMLACSCIMIMQGLYEAEGPANVYRVNRRRHRLDFFNWDLDPTERVTTISALLGQLFMSVSLYGCQQNFVQRYCSMGSFKRVAQTLWANVPVMAILFSLNWVVGMVIFALYADCDPKKIGYISDNDEILPFYVEDKFYFLPGFLGLIMASLFNGALSLLVSNLNSMASVLWEDFVSQIPAMKSLPDSSQLVVIKICGVVCGIIVMGMAFVVAHLSGVIEASQLMTSATTGPLLGVFILAMFFPSANWKGAVAGMIVSHVVILWIAIGSLLVKEPPRDLPTSIEGCSNMTFGPHIPLYHQSALLPLINDSNHLIDQFEEGSKIRQLNNVVNDMSVIHFIYRISYMYYAMMGTLLTVVVGLLVSCFASCTSDEEFEYNEKLLHPLALKLSSLCGGRNKRCYSTEATPNPMHSINTISEHGINGYREKPPV